MNKKQQQQHDEQRKIKATKNSSTSKKKHRIENETMVIKHQANATQERRRCCCCCLCHNSIETSLKKHTQCALVHSRISSSCSPSVSAYTHSQLQAHLIRVHRRWHTHTCAPPACLAKHKDSHFEAIFSVQVFLSLSPRRALFLFVSLSSECVWLIQRSPLRNNNSVAIEGTTVGLECRRDGVAAVWSPEKNLKCKLHLFLFVDINQMAITVLMCRFSCSLSLSPHRFLLSFYFYSGLLWLVVVCFYSFHKPIEYFFGSYQQNLNHNSQLVPNSCICLWFMRCAFQIDWNATVNMAMGSHDDKNLTKFTC